MKKIISLINIIFSITLFFNFFASEELNLEKAYAILGIEQQADIATIDKAYNTLILQCHSDSLCFCKEKNLICFHANIKKAAKEQCIKVNKAFIFIKKKQAEKELYNANNNEKRFILYHKICAINLLKIDLQEIEKIETNEKKEDPELNDFTEIEDFKNELKAAVDFIERNEFIRAKNTLDALCKEHADFDCNNIQEHLKEILNFNHIKEVAIETKK